MRIPFLTTIVLTGMLGLSWSCSQNNDFLTGEGVNLEFSLDTLRFDTVFTERGTVTRFIRVYNRANQPVRISRIELENGTSSPFRLNVDGLPGNVHEGVEIYANDSIYVFVEATIDPDQPASVSPFVIEDKLLFVNGEKSQAVNLEAWGQNANYFPGINNQGVPVILTCDNGEIIWDDDKPYVIFGEVFIDSCTLNIPAGTRVYVHGGIAMNELFGTFNDGILYTLSDGRIHIRGTEQEPVIIQTDRLEEPFLDEPGQWTGIIFGQGSKDNIVEYAVIRNSIFGLYVDSAATVDIKNSEFAYTASSGIVGIHSTIKADNCLLYENYNTSLSLIHGGDYQFNYCTITSYGVDASALSLSNFICYDDPLICEERSIYRMNARFVNSIITGSRQDEIDLLDIFGGQDPGLFNVEFENCLVQVNDLLEQQDNLYADFFETICNPCLQVDRSRDPLFVDRNEDIYTLDSMSVAIGFAKPIPGIENDLAGNARDAVSPDAGCFEYVEE